MDFFPEFFIKWRLQPSIGWLTSLKKEHNIANFGLIYTIGAQPLPYLNYDFFIFATSSF